MEKGKTAFKKFFFPKKPRNSICVISCLIAAVYLFFLFLTNNAEDIQYLNTKGLAYQLCVMFKDFSAVLFSTITTTLLSVWFTETDSKNKLYGDIICNDFFTSDEFYRTLTEENKETALNNTEKHKENV